jgi:uncharacterized protein YjbJ (UPF0337 family)
LKATGSNSGARFNKNGKLTHDDPNDHLDVIEGNQAELAGRLRKRCGYPKDEAQKHIDSWMKTVN